jgi:hypothetical protein
MSKDSGIITAITFGVILGAVLMYSTTRDYYHKELVDRGYAMYCPDTGDWNWKGDCTK